MLLPFNVEDFIRIDDEFTGIKRECSIEDKAILKNFEKIVQEKYSTRVWVIREYSSSLMIGGIEIPFTGATVPNAERIVEFVMELMVTTKHWVYLSRYENLFGRKIFRYMIV